MFISTQNLPVSDLFTLSLRVEVSDGTESDSAIVSVVLLDANDNYPIFGNLPATIRMPEVYAKPYLQLMTTLNSDLFFFCRTKMLVTSFSQ